MASILSLMGTIGIDPGASGGIAKITDDYYQVLAFNGIPSHDINCLRELYQPGDSIYIESVHAIYGASAGSNFSFGRNLGLIEGGVYSTGADTIAYIPPKAWQKAIGIQGIKDKKERKEAFIQKALELFPGVDLHRTPKCTANHSGMADALLICYVATHFLK